MKKQFIILLTLSAAMLLCMGADVFGNEPPAMLIDAKGEVFYSPDGTKWKEADRNKFLFENWRVKTGNDGSCMLLNRESETLEPVNSNSEIEIRKEGTHVISGSVSKSEPARDIAGFLKRKFAKLQKYTGIRRYGREDGNIRLETAAEISLSEDYPDMVWENAGPKYNYQLIVGKKIFEVPGSTEDIIRFPLHSLTPGQFAYAVQVLYDGETVYAAKKKNRLRWLNDAEKSALRKEEQRIREVAPDNRFLLGNLLDERGLKVAAMDQYLHFLSQEPDEDEIRPFLIRVLDELKLEKSGKEEMAKYHK